MAVDYDLYLCSFDSTILVAYGIISASSPVLMILSCNSATYDLVQCFLTGGMFTSSGMQRVTWWYAELFWNYQFFRCGHKIAKSDY